ncbi:MULTISPECIES: pro-sigmaK processing inhibitor BofA family protein [Sellimonas]|uniref:Pro-sigmaK processing inhibitor BofA n=1 Tax=Sellimonas caecigallum TaxID=2592333 RepID=A0ABS7L6V5_9FIRM|nr:MULTISPECIES: pro-sigmaK processing inhibitor BofA family protein [Sellimonas]MBY0758764.1 Pro-sigmaK processing inhibitor BofA [Sellimonas caecigallum]OUP00951.1 Pro-sigmaK processing inhibitor BofA [Drancourtella sp. An210]OUP66742.1 Pro-sigmaK processing inhibitor BofA [Drancourtella sp. An177]
MKERGSGFVVNFIVRVIVGMAVIFFINQFLESQGMDRTVGINLVSFLTSGFLGLPGVALLYGILLWEIL